MVDLTTAQVAAELSASRETVRRLISSGELRAYRLSSEGSPWRVRPEELDAYRERRQNRDPWVRSRPRRR